MSSPSAVACREIFDENSQPSAEEISEYAQQLGIDPESESHLLSLARDGLMQALPPPWKAYFDEKLQTHYYYNEETKKTQWEHPLDNVYRELVKKVRDASVVDDTCASVQELPTSEEHTKNLERVETKVESDEELSTDSENHQSEVKDITSTLMSAPRRLVPLGRPPLSPLTRMDKKLGDLRISPLRRSAENPVSCKPLLRNISDRDLLNRPAIERPKMLFKQQSETIDLKMNVLNLDEDSFNQAMSPRVDKGLPLAGKGSMFFRVSKSDLPSPDTDKSLPLDSVTKSDPPKGILREKASDNFYRRTESINVGKPKTTSFEEDRKSVRFQLEGVVSASASSTSSSDRERPSVCGPRPPAPRDGNEAESAPLASPRRRVVRPPPADYIQPDLFQKDFHKISDLLRPGDKEGTGGHLEPPAVEKESRPRSPMIPQKNKISINLMESIESETSIDSPDREFANLDLNDLDDTNEQPKTQTSQNDPKDIDSAREKEENSKTSNRTSENSIPQIKVPNLELPKNLISDTDNSKSIDDSKVSKCSNDKSQIKSPLSEMRSPRLDYNKTWSPLSTYKPVAKSLSPQIKSETKGLTSPRLDGVIISQGKSNSDNVVVVYQFETNDESPKPIKSPLIPDMGKDMIERTKTDERRRLELSLQKELEGIRIEWSAKERKMRAELQEELKEAEEKFLNDKRTRLNEQADRHKREIEEALSSAEKNHQQNLQCFLQEIEDKYSRESELAEEKHAENMQRMREQYKARLMEQQEKLEIENERALSELHEQLQTSLAKERAALIEQNKETLKMLKDDHAARIADLKHDYRAEVDRLRTTHLCHVSELRARLAQRDTRDTRDKYRALKEKYAKLKHDVKMSIERRNKRREMSMTTGSETEKSNSHKVNPSLERCKEVNETSVSACIEMDPPRSLNQNLNHHPSIKYNDNETSCSESHPHRNTDNNNDDWKLRRDNSADTSQTSGSKQRPHRRTAVAFKEPPKMRRKQDKDRDTGTTTDFQDSSDATTADEKPKENVNGPGRRRCFTRLKSASTSRLNYSPKRGEGWSSPLESLRQQLRKLDDLEDQFPDLACQPSYSLRYPFSELGAGCADSAELEFVRHRALVEREGMRRARTALRTRRDQLRHARRDRAPDEEREATELEVALHRARALLGEKEIRLRHIERALTHIARAAPAQEAASSSGSSGSSRGGPAGGAVLRSLRALHADVRDIWRALDARRHPASPETSSCNAATTSQTRMTLSAPDPMTIQHDNSDNGVSERARGLRAWLQTTP